MSQQIRETTLKGRKAGWTSIVVMLTLIFSLSVQEVMADRQNNPTVSIKSQKTPLETVLKDVGHSSGYTIVIGEDWKSTPISVNFDNLPLEDALKRILANLNHVVIYESERIINVVIYGVAEPDRGSTSFTGSNTLPQPDGGPDEIEAPPSDRGLEQVTPDRPEESESANTGEASQPASDTEQATGAEDSAEDRRPE